MKYEIMKPTLIGPQKYMKFLASPRFGAIFILNQNYNKCNGSAFWSHLGIDRSCS